MDQINILEELKEVEIKNLAGAFPILFLPFLSRASEIIGKRILVNIDANEFLFNFNQSISVKNSFMNILEIGEVVKLKILENVNLFSEEEWNELYKLSENTFVEETEELKKSAAGAGLTDND